MGKTGDRFGVARLGLGGFRTVPARDDVEFVVQVEDERRAGRQVQLQDLFVGDVEQVFDERAQAVAVGGDEDVFAWRSSGAMLLSQ